MKSQTFRKTIIVALISLILICELAACRTTKCDFVHSHYVGYK